jgi:hypothetical protein
MISEIREPFGSGIDQGREAVAIRCISFRTHVPQQGALCAFPANVDAILADVAENLSDLQSTGTARSGQGYRGTPVYDLMPPPSHPIVLAAGNRLRECDIVPRTSNAPQNLSRCAKSLKASRIAIKGLKNHG